MFILQSVYTVYMAKQVINETIQEQEERRYLKAELIAKVGHIHQFQGELKRWLVQSMSHKKTYYMVTVDRDFECCTCADSQFRGNTCKHILSVAIRYARVV
jgi:SWIM zinc finger